MTLSYRTRRVLRGMAIAALILILLMVMVWLVWLVWLDRYVIYTSEGAVLDFSQSDKNISGVVAVPPEDKTPVSIYYNEGDNTLNISTELAQVYGYYITTDMLDNDMDTVMAQLRKLPAQTPVLVEVKDIVGRFYYSTELGPVDSTVDVSRVEELFLYLKLSDLYAIAKFPALRDYYYGLDHVSDGIYMKNGKGLWMDDDRCYWLNPESQSIQARLVEIITELKDKGFNEVVLGDYAVPVHNGLKFNGDRNAILSATAQSILNTCGTDRFAVSFCDSDMGFTVPTGRTRLYVEDPAASSLKELAEKSGLEDPQIRLVFLTDVNDTRFDEYGVLRPLTSAQLDE